MKWDGLRSEESRAEQSTKGERVDITSSQSRYYIESDGVD